MRIRHEHSGGLPAHARQAMVATADEHATVAAVDILREGGTVVDAAIAAGFALCVTQPGMCGLGGGGQMVAFMEGVRPLCLDFREQAPLAAHRGLFVGQAEDASLIGWNAAAVPGLVKGLSLAHLRGGRLPWKRLLQPAIALASGGHAVAWLRSRMLATCDALYRDPESHRILLNSGRPFDAGDRLVQPELAATLERIAGGGDDEFYSGETAERLAAGMSAHGGAVTLEDLASYTVAETEPLAGDYRGRKLWTMPPSSAGGIGLLQILGMLEGTRFAAEGPGSSLFFHYLAEAMRRTFADRAVAIGDPAFASVPVAELLDPARLTRLRNGIDPLRATPSAEFGVGTVSTEAACTTHISVLDCNGSAAALTITLNGMYGSGVTVPGLGFLLNNNMDNFAVRPGAPNQYGVVQGEVNAIGPRKRPVSSMTPTIVHGEGGAEIVLGTPGGPTIVSAVAQVLLYILEFGWNVRDAVTVPRIHHQWLPDVLYHEPGIPADVTRALEARGHWLEIRPSKNDMNAIVRREGWLEGAADPRREGYACGF